MTFVGFLGWVVYRTIVSLGVHRAGPLWGGALGLLLLTGCGTGFYLGFSFQYQVSETTILCSFPVPAAILKLEDGHWIDYISPVTPILALLNALLITFGFVLPLTVSYTLWRKLG
jgi:hypothetical protein